MVSSVSWRASGPAVSYPGNRDPLVPAFLTAGQMIPVALAVGLLA